MGDGIFRKIGDDAEPAGSTVRKLCCQGCGATLPIDEGVRFLTCNYCHSRLEVVRDRETTHTKLLDGLEARTSRIERKLDVVELRSRLSELDAAWNRYRESVSSRDKAGNLHPPAMDLVLGMTAICGVAAAVLVVMLATELPVLAAAIAIAGFFLTKLCWKNQSLKVRSYEASRAQYEVRRRNLLDLIERCRGERS